MSDINEYLNLPKMVDKNGTPFKIKDITSASINEDQVSSLRYSGDGNVIIKTIYNKEIKVPQTTILSKKIEESKLVFENFKTPANTPLNESHLIVNNPNRIIPIQSITITDFDKNSQNISIMVDGKPYNMKYDSLTPEAKASFDDIIKSMNSCYLNSSISAIPKPKIIKVNDNPSSSQILETKIVYDFSKYPLPSKLFLPNDKEKIKKMEIEFLNDNTVIKLTNSAGKTTDCQMDALNPEMRNFLLPNINNVYSDYRKAEIKEKVTTSQVLNINDNSAVDVKNATSLNIKESKLVYNFHTKPIIVEKIYDDDQTIKGQSLFNIEITEFDKDNQSVTLKTKETPNGIPVPFDKLTPEIQEHLKPEIQKMKDIYLEKKQNEISDALGVGKITKSDNSIIPNFDNENVQSIKDSKIIYKDIKGNLSPSNFSPSVQINDDVTSVEIQYNGEYTIAVIKTASGEFPIIFDLLTPEMQNYFKKDADNLKNSYNKKALSVNPAMTNMDGTEALLSHVFKPFKSADADGSNKPVSSVEYDINKDMFFIKRIDNDTIINATANQIEGTTFENGKLIYDISKSPINQTDLIDLTDNELGQLKGKKIEKIEISYKGNPQKIKLVGKSNVSVETTTDKFTTFAKQHFEPILTNMKDTYIHSSIQKANPDPSLRQKIEDSFKEPKLIKEDGSSIIYDDLVGDRYTDKSLLDKEVVNIEKEGDELTLSFSDETSAIFQVEQLKGNGKIINQEVLDNTKKIITDSKVQFDVSGKDIKFSNLVETSNPTFSLLDVKKVEVSPPNVNIIVEIDGNEEKIKLHPSKLRPEAQTFFANVIEKQANTNGMFLDTKTDTKTPTTPSMGADVSILPSQPVVPLLTAKISVIQQKQPQQTQHSQQQTQHSQQQTQDSQQETQDSQETTPPSYATAETQTYLPPQSSYPRYASRYEYNPYPFGYYHTPNNYHRRYHQPVNNMYRSPYFAPQLPFYEFQQFLQFKEMQRQMTMQTGLPYYPPYHQPSPQLPYFPPFPQLHPMMNQQHLQQTQKQYPQGQLPLPPPPQEYYPESFKSFIMSQQKQNGQQASQQVKPQAQIQTPQEESEQEEEKPEHEMTTAQKLAKHLDEYIEKKIIDENSVEYKNYADAKKHLNKKGFDSENFSKNRTYKERTKELEEDSIELSMAATAIRQNRMQKKRALITGDSKKVKMLDMQYKVIINKMAQKHLPTDNTKARTDIGGKLSVAVRPWKWKIWPNNWGGSKGWGLTNKEEMLFGTRNGKVKNEDMLAKSKTTRTCLKLAALTDQNVVVEDGKARLVAANGQLKVCNGYETDSIDEAMNEYKGLFSSKYVQFEAGKMFRGRHLRTTTHDLYERQKKCNESLEILMESINMKIAIKDGREDVKKQTHEQGGQKK